MNDMSSLSRPSLRAYRPIACDDLIRVGKDFDGGYVMPRFVIKKSSALLSLGVNDDWSFEEGVLAHQPGMRVTCVDGTTGFWRIARKTAQKLIDMIGHFFSLQWDKAKRDALYARKLRDFPRFFARHELIQLMVSKQRSATTTTLPDLLDKVTAQHGDDWIMLKSDIEGAEYEALPDAIAKLARVSVLLVEFHALDRHWRDFEACMSALASGFHVAHIHGNNFDGFIPGSAVPITLEVTLVNKQLITSDPAPSRRTYPLPSLDMPNNRKRPDYALHFD